MITIEQYFGKWIDSADITTVIRDNADKLVSAVNALINEMETFGIIFPNNPKTHSQVSGEVYGGFRPQACPIGAIHSNHKQGLAVDLFDPMNLIDDWCTANTSILAQHGIWLEHPGSTPGWSHWQCVAPRSGNRIFIP
jgi:hypothetical protein